MRHRHGHCSELQPQVPTFPLAMSNEGESVIITVIPKGIKLQERLLSMGISVQDRVTVVQKQIGGAVIVDKEGSRYALGGGMALKIGVVKA